MIDDDNNITGVFNYCDAWCARCPFTSRCANFAMGEEMRRLDESGDLENERFWRELEKGLADALAFVEDEEDIEDLYDGNPGPTGFGDDFDEELRRTKAKDHACAVSSYAYIDMIDEWFKAAGFRYDEATDTLRPAGETTEGKMPYDDAVEIIRWYQRYIHVKIVRAVHGALDALDDCLLELDPQGDENGSAKVALIGIDRSLSAWNIILKSFPQEKKRTIPIMALLAGLRRRVEEEFPGARAFVRPGFDTEEK